MSSVFEMVGASFILILGMMAILWVIYYFKRNAGIVDIGWALSYLIAIWSYFFLAPGWLPRKLILTLMVTLWAGRLAYYLFDRFQRSEEDPRYADMRKRLGDENSEFKFFILFIFQGLLVIFLTIPFIISSLNANPHAHPLEGLGFFIWFIGLAGETLADKQMSEFKHKPENKNKVCQVGLWRYTRHPNYFFEFVVWIGFALFALASPGGILAITAPTLILYLLLKVSGVPLAEAQSLKTKGDEYRKYQEKTSEFVPWIPK